jgi:hypothetical protein
VRFWECLRFGFGMMSFVVLSRQFSVFSQPAFTEN